MLARVTIRVLFLFLNAAFLKVLRLADKVNDMRNTNMIVCFSNCQLDMINSDTT